MPKLAPKKRMRPGLVTGGIATVSLIFLAIAALLTVNSGVLATMTSFLSDAGPGGSSDISQIADESSSLPEQSDTEKPQEQDQLPQDIIFAKPGQMKGVYLTAGKDYLINENDSGQTVKAQIDAAFDKLSEWKFNTVLVPLWSGGRTLYLSSVNADSIIITDTGGSRFDAPAYILKCARERGFFTYGVLDLRVNQPGGADPSAKEGSRFIHDMVAEAVSRYSFDGWLLDNPGYAFGKCGSFDSYMTVMPGGGFDNFLRDSVTAAVADAVTTIKAKSVNLYVGLLADGVWAHKATDKRGSETSGVYESLADGHADTRAWIEKGLFDFVMVDNGYSTGNGSAPFSNVLKWWTGVCQEFETDMYVLHHSDKVCGGEQGWLSPDQLAQQVIYCKSNDGWAGSAFTSFSALAKDGTGSTTALIKTFGGTLKEEYISRKLMFNTPSKTVFTTYESMINIRGSADPNFKLTMNNKEVQLSAHGFFSIDLNLSLGLNTYTFSHKGDIITFKITYRVVLLKNIQPEADVSFDGETTLGISAVALKGANVYAKIGDKTVKMKQTTVQSDEDDSDGQSDYTHYMGEYVLPKGIINKQQNLGSVVVYGSYNGLSESKRGGTITVKALTLPDPGSSNPTYGGDNDPVDPSAGGTVLGTGKIVYVSSNYAETFNGDVLENWSRPTNASLPRGTTDIAVAEKNFYDKENKKWHDFYLLACGRRIYKSDVKVYNSNGKITSNKLTTKAVEINTKATEITLDTMWYVPYNVRLLPQKYGNESTQNYNITSFTAQYVDITFSYTPSVSGTPDVSASPLFKSAEWINGGGNTHTLRLHLRETGKYYGYSVGWNKKTLVFSFKNPEGAYSGSKPLKGKRIVIDPGHGGSSPGATRGKVYEKDLALEYGISLRQKLIALGATVIMTRTNDTLPDNALNPPSLYARTNHARNNYTDLFLSIHMDGAASGSARGYTIFYFNEFAQPFAKSIDKFAKTAYKECGGVSNRANTVNWKYFTVMNLHDCPSVLIECGFMSNDADLELIISDKYQNKFTQAMADGIVDYFKKIRL